MDPIHLTTREALVWAAIINAVVGFVLGLIPLLFGYFNKQFRTGVIAIVITTLGGALLGIFISIPATIIFTWLISRRAKAHLAGVPHASDDAADVPVDSEHIH